MVSALERAKRALVAVIQSVAATYGLALGLTRDSLEQAVRTAYRKV